MSPPSVLPPLFLCIILLFIPIVSPETKISHSSGRNRPTATENPSPENQQSPSDGATENPMPRKHSKPLYAREFLTAHNKVRMNVTHPVLSWDRGLARYARRWGTKRTVDCKMVHSYGPYGENLFWGALDHWTPTDAVESWSKERRHYDAQTNSCVEGEMCGHYTQVIWRDTTKLGCTRVRCQIGGVLIICEYDPPGNYVNETPFDTVNATATPPAATPTPSPATPTPTPRPAGTATATATATAGTAGTATATANGGGGTVAVDLKSKVPEPSPPSNEQIISPHRKLIG
ncbi:pathogenesis-related protein 1-like [Cucurbita moschata]|uniref:Pathogenesis-related protein 1-like n=1 Tax=Cucurbita moschata TaxID=3662 RepID=A0A6J1GE47_CUCMO|nr:pathogenesis-related protein 1-like [Cucurbita moschata]